jgi:hypothetical protein
MDNYKKKKDIEEPKTAVNKAIDKTEIVIDHENHGLSIFPNRMRKILNGYQFDLVESQLQFKKRTIDAYREQQYKLFTEGVANYVKNAVLHMRKDNASINVHLQDALEREVSEIHNDFIDFIQEKFKKLERVIIPELREGLEEQLMKAVERFDVTINKCMDDFMMSNSSQVV